MATRRDVVEAAIAWHWPDLAKAAAASGATLAEVQKIARALDKHNRHIPRQPRPPEAEKLPRRERFIPKRGTGN